ncbi:MAG: alpha-glucuronidase family glycosyl hydrolase [Kiritimatiellae bacterium]|nr:alpha-glucuronidase family glycosyl hydrolase [Kiritimatiellia bacterium]
MPLAKHKLRYEGTRWSIVYGSREGVECFALSELQRNIQRRLPYVIGVHGEADGDLLRNDHVILLGTCANNPLIAELAKQKRLAIPRRKEGYAVACMESPWGRGTKALVIAGHDAAGVLYGAEDFNARLEDNATLLGSQHPTTENLAWLREDFDAIRPFAYAEAPAIEDRGIWTWGYVIYDYRRFFDNMARLRLNMATIWNDCPPLNCPEALQYAHSRGVRVVLGFPWGWGYGNLDLSKARDRRIIRQAALKDYREHYRHLDIDGLYFQTLTEHSKTRLAGKSIAAWTCLLVNEIAGELLRERPDIPIQFGLHATSIQKDYPHLRKLDPRVVIAWEDAGVIPYSYDPVTWCDGHPMTGKVRALGSPERTIRYSERLATFRHDAGFAMVPKGWMLLRWGDEFEHHGPFIMGERDPEFIRRRLHERQPRWDRMNALWLQNYPLAAKFYRAILACRPPRVTVTGLVEDGLFEETIQPSVALFAETLWNPRRSDKDILQRAMSPYYRRGL